MDLSPEDYRRAINAALTNRPAPDGPVLAVFQPQELAAAIEHEVERTVNLKNQRITIHMDPIDAMLLVKYLRFGAL